MSYGLVTGRAARGTRRVVVSANGRVLVSKPLRGRRFSLRLTLPTGDVAVRVTTVASGGRRSSRVVENVYGLPVAARPRIVESRQDPALARKLRTLARQYRGTAGFYVQSLTGGAGAAWNARARFPAASTLKLAIAATVLAEHTGIPPPGSRISSLLREVITHSDNASANALEIWLAGSTSSGGRRVDALLRSIGIEDSLMYGGYAVERALALAIPLRVDEQPLSGIGKYTTAHDLASMARAVWLASAGLGPLARRASGFTAADGRHLLYLLAHVRDPGKLDREIGRDPGVRVLHKAGWIGAARHDNGLVVWPGGIYVAAVMTWRPSGTGVREDALAGRVAKTALDRFRG